MKSIVTYAVALAACTTRLHADGNDTVMLPVPEDVPHAIKENTSPRTENVTYMGVATSILPNVLRDHLGLQKGVGLKIDQVEPGSPADKAGIKPNDILTMLDDQQIINSHQLTVLVRMRKAGDMIALRLISQGKPVTVNLALGQKEMPIVEYPIAIIPGDQTQNPLPRTGEERASSVIRHVDNEHSITINMHDDQRDVVIKDKQNNILYTGPLNTTDDLQKIPTVELRDKVELVQKAAGNFKLFRDSRPENINRGNNGAM